MYLEEYETCRDGQPEVARPLFQIGIDLLREGIEEMRGLTQHLQETSSDATLTTGVQELPEEFEGEQQIEFGHHPTDDRELFRPCVEVR
jgi:signal transduction histidine kinase